MQATKVHVIVYRQTEPGADLNILLMEKSSNGGSTWNLVTGFIETGESSAECAVRETIEETGLTALALPLDLECHHTFISRFTGKAECEYGFAIQSINLDEVVEITHNPDAEHVGFQWVDVDEAHLLLHWDSWKESLHALLQELQ
jgi:lipoyl(octanoyl) transferase